MNIVVLAGGFSPERDVSLSSGALISNALIENGHNVMLLDLYLGTDSKDFDAVYRNNNSDFRYSYTVNETEPDLEKLKEQSGNGKSQIGRGVTEICKDADKVFLALHGAAGENGQLQAVFDMLGIDYTGSGYEGSLLAMNKDLSKQIMVNNGILTADWKFINLNEPYSLDNVKFPCVVKPCGCGSSVGVAIVENKAQLTDAISQAKKYETFVLIEEKIEGREFSVGILGGKALPPIEIKPVSGFYDYKNKYQQGMTEEICPADITEFQDELLKENALKVHKALRLGYYSRIDFILTDDNKAYCLEANTLPGMTPTSLLPQEASAVGISYNELCEKIVFEN